MIINNVIQIPRVSHLNSSQFYHEHFKTKQPIVITDMMQEWPAMQKWTFQFFRELDSNQKLYIEKGNVIQGKTDFHQLSLSDYIEKLLADNDKEENTKEYLSVFNIFNVFPALKEDVDFSLLRKHTYKSYVFAWLGPKGTLTGYHIDWADNLLAQIHGRKHLSLVSPQQSKWMYPSKKYDFRATLSSVEPDDYNPEKHPLFKNVQPIETILNPGDMIYIPRGWWHRVKSLDKSISVNNFGQDFIGMVYYQFRAELRELLHKTGLYRPNCTCHMNINGKRVAK